VKACTIDNVNTMARETWVDGVCVTSVSARLCLDPYTWASGEVRGDPDAMNAQTGTPLQLCRCGRGYVVVNRRCHYCEQDHYDALDAADRRGDPDPEDDADLNS
jgi:hypothetical protein